MLKDKLLQLVSSTPEGSDFRIGNREPDIWLEKLREGHFELREANLVTEFDKMRQDRLADLNHLRGEVTRVEFELEDLERMYEAYVPPTADTVDLELFTENTLDVRGRALPSLL